MGKPYMHAYHFAGYGGRTGTMVCSKCHQPISNQLEDWMSYVKPTKYDWGFVCVHRKCSDDQSGWVKLEREKDDKAKAHSDCLEKLREVARVLHITSSMEFARLAAEALGDDDLDETYFAMYGSS